MWRIWEDIPWFSLSFVRFAPAFGPPRLASLRQQMAGEGSAPLQRSNRLLLRRNRPGPEQVNTAFGYAVLRQMRDLQYRPGGARKRPGRGCRQSGADRKSTRLNSS